MASKPMFTIEDAARAAGISPNTLRTQFQRGVFAPGPDDKAAARHGDPRMFSPHTVLSIAIANALAKLGVPLGRAASAGDTFAHTDMGEPRRGKRRNVGLPYRFLKGERDTHTFMRISPDAGEDDLPEIFPLCHDMPAVEILQHIGLFREEGGGVAGGIVLHIDPIVARFERELAIT